MVERRSTTACTGPVGPPPSRTRVRGGSVPHAYEPPPELALALGSHLTSRAFRRFVRSYGRFFGHDILDYREQSRDAFSRPFGKEAPYANAHCSPHHFSAKGPGGAAHFSPSPYHPAIPGLTRPYGLKGCRGGPADQLTNRPRVGVFQPHGGQMAAALPGA